MLINRAIITTACLFLMLVNTAHAGWVPPAWHYGQTIDRPAQEASQVGWAQDPRWQMLGDSWGTSDGVSWTMLDASKNPVGAYGHDVVNVGTSVRFKFDIHKTLYGIHTFDALRAWIDWDHDGFSATDMASDQIIQDQLLFNPNNRYSDNPRALLGPHGTFVPPPGYGPGPFPSAYYADLDHSFYVDVTFTETGYFDLWARVTCSTDLAGNWDNLTPWPNGLYQGEIEKYTVRVVPLPPALLLLGSGLMSLGVFRRRSGTTARPT